MTQTSQTHWTVSSPEELERVARLLRGPLAGAVAGSEGNSPVRSIFMGDQNVSPVGDNWFALAAWLNRAPVWPLRKLAHHYRLYGNLLTALFFSHKSKNAKVSVTADADGTLRCVSSPLGEGETLSFTWRKEGSEVYLEQTLQFGKRLQDGSERLTLPYSYDGQSGALRSTGPTAVDEQKFLRQNLNLPGEAITPELAATFERLTGHGCRDSLTFGINSGVVLPALEFLKNPELKLDFHRAAVYALHFTRMGTPAVQPGDAISAAVCPRAVRQTDKGQMLTVLFSLSVRQVPIADAEIDLLVRGNFPGKVEHVLPLIPWRNLAHRPGFACREISFMDDGELSEFAAINGDYNPLHQVDGVARIVGFRKKINPGLSVVAEIETALRHCFPQLLGSISATFIRPVYPGQSLRLEFAPAESSYRYQLIRPGKKPKVLVDGQFTMSPEKPQTT